MKRYSENCWPSTPPPLDAAMLKFAFNSRVIAFNCGIFTNVLEKHLKFLVDIPALNSACNSRSAESGWRAEDLDSKPRLNGHPSEVLRFPEKFLPLNSCHRITWSSPLNPGWRREPDTPILDDCCNLLQGMRNHRQSNPSGTSNLRHLHHLQLCHWCYSLRRANSFGDPFDCWMKRKNVTWRH